MRYLLQAILRVMASAVLKKYKPEIIGITGSVGKTSAKDAIAHVLSGKYRVQASKGNYNNEIGVPLTILGKDTAGHSIFGWFDIFIGAAVMLFKKDKNFPEILILEMAADKPGDIEYLTSFIPLKVAVITAVAPAHLEKFGDLKSVAREKGQILKKLGKNCTAVLNIDDENVRKMKDETKAKIIYFGYDKKADIRVSDPKFIFSAKGGSALGGEKDGNTPTGISFKILDGETMMPAIINGTVGFHLASTSLAAVSVAKIYGFNLLETIERLETLKLPPGRMNIIAGIKKTTIIDDTYNASPRPTKAAIEMLGLIPILENNKRFAVLGDMLELGEYTVKAHEEIGAIIAENKVDIFVAVGEKMNEAARMAEKIGMNEDRIFHFGTPEEAGKFLQDRIKKGDLLLVKGSRRMRMEKVVEELMEDPLRADELLVH